MNREQWRALCELELGKPYVWGGEGPAAYDCSGFVQWALKPLGLDPPGDQTASGLHKFFCEGRSVEVKAEGARLGDIVFYGSDEAVTHVALAWGDEKMLEAGGGGRKTTTVEIARKIGAEVRIRAIARRSDLVAILRPKALEWPGGAILEAIVESPSGHGSYTNGPPLTEWLDDGRSMRLKRPFGFVEEGGREWPVPAEAIVDGASIPRVFWSLIGGPFEGSYRDASIVHDHYCDVQSRAWRDTHRVFYEAMRCSGVGNVRAKTMYYAVYRFGPRWTMGPAAVAEAFDAMGGPDSVPTPLPVEAFDAASFEADASRISDQDLGLADIEALADARAVGAPSAILESVSEALPDGTAAPALNGLAAEALAMFSRRPLLERLTTLQDVASSPPELDAAGAMLARYTADVLVRSVGPQVESGLSFEDLEAKYTALYASCRIRPERAGQVAWHREKLKQYRRRYEAVGAKTGVPWWFIGVVHALEASFNFTCHLHNGDPLTGRTVQVPPNRPKVWNPPNDWESSAVDALAYENLVGLSDWSVARALHRWEAYNGFGYHSRQINSPYLWSFSNHYKKGKFVADRKFDPEAISKQCGAAVMLRALEDAGLVDMGSS